MLQICPPEKETMESRSPKSLSNGRTLEDKADTFDMAMAFLISRFTQPLALDRGRDWRARLAWLGPRWLGGAGSWGGTPRPGCPRTRGPRKAPRTHGGEERIWKRYLKCGREWCGMYTIHI